MSTGLDIHEHLHRTDTSGASSGPADALRSTLAQAKSVGDLEYNGACPEPMRRNGLNPVQELQHGAPSANLTDQLGGWPARASLGRTVGGLAGVLPIDAARALNGFSWPNI